MRQTTEATEPAPEDAGEKPSAGTSDIQAEEQVEKSEAPTGEADYQQKQEADGPSAKEPAKHSTEGGAKDAIPTDGEYSGAAEESANQAETDTNADKPSVEEKEATGAEPSDKKEGDAPVDELAAEVAATADQLDDPVLKSTEGVPATDGAMAGHPQPPQPARATQGTAEQLVGEPADEPVPAATITDDMEEPQSGKEALEKIEKEKAELGNDAHPEAAGTVTNEMVKEVTEGHEEERKQPDGEDEEVRGDDENIR